jgi:F-type H+-transporting ATPase subunit epsilon
MSKTFNLKLIAPSGVKYESEATAVFLPTSEGTIEVLPDHMPLIALLAPGEITIKNGGTEKVLVTDGGMVEIADNLVKILADEAEEAANLDEMKILEAKHAAEDRLANSKDSVEHADATAHLEKQISKLNILTKHKRRHQR